MHYTVLIRQFKIGFLHYNTSPCCDKVFFDVKKRFHVFQDMIQHGPVFKFLSCDRELLLFIIGEITGFPSLSNNGVKPPE